VSSPRSPGLSHQFVHALYSCPSYDAGGITPGPWKLRLTGRRGWSFHSQRDNLPQKLEAVLQRSEVSHKINTSYVERTNGTVRHLDARCSRKTYRFSKCTQNHQRQLALSLTYYHLCLPHKTLTKYHGQATTPFMAAGLTDHVWTMRELLQYQPE
jgi:hypothetical protein